MIRQLNLLGGAVYLDGARMQDMPEKEIARRMAILMTERIHPELMTCEDVAGTGRYPYTGRMGILSAQDRKKVREALELDRFSQVLMFSTEGNTDPMKFRKVLWDGEYPTV